MEGQCRWRSWVAVVVAMWTATTSGLPLGVPLPYHANSASNTAPLARLGGAYHEGRAGREIDTAATTKLRPGSPLHALEFMKKFGYVENFGDENTDFVYTPQSLEDALIRVQEFGGIPQTGKLDNATIKLMGTPRCGLPDLRPEELDKKRNNRVKRYIIGAAGWNKRRLTYFIANWSPQLRKKEVVQQELRRAFDAWTQYSRLTFTEVFTPDADIIVYFASQDHGDGYPFDYKGGILAHAFYPYDFGHYGGDVHFDESEKWIVAKDPDEEGLDFFTVAVHELGHSLGLSHSPVSGSIMYPYYMGYNKDFALHYDDVMAMWELYIKRKLEGDDEYFKNDSNNDDNSTTTTTTTTTRPPFTDHQSDAASDDYDEETENDVEEEEEEEEDMYEKDKKRREEVERRREEERRWREEEERRRREEEDIRRREEETRRREEEERRRWEEEEDRKKWEEERRKWEEEEEEWRKRGGENNPPTATPTETSPIPNVCEGDFDAMAVLRQEFFIFKGKYIWRYYDRGHLVDGFPATIHTLFPTLPTHIDRINAVYERPEDGNIVFFIGEHFYVHDGNQLIEGSPRPLYDLGLPSHVTEITAAFYWPRAHKTYFFTQNEYFRYNGTSGKMDPGYPKPMYKWNGLPNGLDAVFTWTDGKSYFVKGSEYWQYDNRLIRPMEGYPQSAINFWAGCY